MQRHLNLEKISLFLPTLSGGGAERICLNLAKGFSSRGYAIDIVLANAVGEYLNQIPNNVRIIDLGADRPIKSIPALTRYLSSERPRALLSTIINANLAALAAVRLTGLATRCVVREASTLSIDLAQSSRFNRVVVRKLVSRSFTRAHAVVAPSQGVADDLQRVADLPRELIHVIYNPVVSEAMLVRSRETPDHPWLKDKGVPVIIGMGRLTRQKDFTTLLKAFARLKVRIHSKLLILGEGEDRAALVRLSQSLGVDGDVDFVGFVANPYAYLSRAALFVLSSRWEGLPGVLIEALACGTQVVATDCPSGPSEILQDGKYGQMVPIGDVKAMAIAMENALTGNYVPADPDQFLDLFDMESNTDRYLELLIGENDR